MFSFIHGYMPNTEYWNGLVRRGFITDKSGVKLTQHAFSKPHEMFNQVAAIGTELHEIIKESNRPFYIDRLQGGTYYYDYDYDLTLIDHYATLLEDNFHGFQMHEWASNYLQDWARLQEVTAGMLTGKGIDGFTENEIIEAVKRKYPFAYVMLESQSAKEFSEQSQPKTIEELELALQSLFTKRMSKVNGHILPADSYYIGYGMECRLGATKLMPEVGGQIRYTRVQLAMARGAAKARDISFGTYYEPWGGSPFSSCYYKNDLINEWGITSATDFPFQTNGVNGGSSRHLQRRILFYSYLSGASFISEEWGVCNTFYDWTDFELSPYGRITKEFLEFTHKYPNIGKTYTPFAIVLPKGKGFFNLDWLSGQTDQYLSASLDSITSENVSRLASVFHMIYGDGQADDPKYSQETGIMTNSRYGDLFDIVYEDYCGITDQYDYLIDLTGKTSFAANNPMAVNRIIKANSDSDLLRVVDTLIAELIPFTVKGDIHWIVNKNDNKWIVGFFNNKGVTRNAIDGESTDPSANATVSVTLKSGEEFKVLYGDESELSIEVNKKDVRFTVAAGKLAVIEI